VIKLAILTFTDQQGAKQVFAELIAAKTAVLTESQTLGGAGGDADETVHLTGIVSGDNGNGGTYNATVEVTAHVSITQTNPPTKPDGSSSSNSQ